MRHADKCSQLEQRAMSSGDDIEWKEHASRCAACMERIRILGLLCENSRNLNLRLDRRNVSVLETAIAGRAASNNSLSFRLTAYVLPLVVLLAVACLVIFYPDSPARTKSSHSFKSDVFGWESKISGEEIGRRINSALKIRHADGKDGNPVTRKSKMIKRKVQELCKSIEKV